MTHQPTQLREVSEVRVVGFNDAVRDLGSHTMHGNPVPYTRSHVFNVLTGRTATSEALLVRIAQRRPDLFGLRYVSPDVRAWADANAARIHAEYEAEQAAKAEA